MPLSPRAAAFVSPRGWADHEARAPGWGAGAGCLGLAKQGGVYGERIEEVVCFLKVARNGTEASRYGVFPFSVFKLVIIKGQGF